MYLKMSSVKWRQFGLGLKVLNAMHIFKCKHTSVYNVAYTGGIQHVKKKFLWLCANIYNEKKRWHIRSYYDLNVLHVVLCGTKI